MEEESRISYEDMKGMVEAMSEVAGRLVPGMSLFYRENLLRRGSWDSFDSKEIAVAKTCSPGTAVRDALPGTCPEHVRNRNMQPEACPEPEHVRNPPSGIPAA